MLSEALPTEQPSAAARFFTEKELAELLRIAPSSVRNLRARGEIAFVRLALNRGRVVYLADDVARFSARQRRAPAEQAA